jgi:3-deoxy-manno-octulosonate cytidylyltransferase (CMP-KDO synthetase)
VLAATIVIPTRLDSSRFPRKALADATGRPLVLHVVDQARKATCADRVIVAAPDREILDVVTADGHEAMETRLDHPNGTSRLAEVAERLSSELAEDAIIVNVQGDEPEIEPEAIDAVVEALASDPDADMATIASPFGPDQDPMNPNIVKVVTDLRGRALYFSRSPIPFDRDATGHLPRRHVGLYAYRRAFLPRFAAWPESPLERLERLEQLRVLENGGTIAVADFDCRGTGIDTPEQYDAFVRLRLRRSREQE